MRSPKSDLVKIPFNGSSMWPVVHDGESVIVEIGSSQVPEAADAGRLFVFKESSEWICHRFLGKYEGKYLFKGDFSTTWEFLERPKILGMVRAVESRDRYRYEFRQKHLHDALTWLQRSAVFAPERSRKVFRHIAIILACAVKPLLYRKIKPTQIVK